MIRSILLSLGAAALAFAPQISPAQNSGRAAGTGPASIEVAKAEPFGEYLTDAEGRALYMFEADSKGKTTCYTDCAEAWPPLLTAGDPEVGEKLDDTKAGTIERKDGKRQVTYGGWPLYYFVKDKGPGTTAGQDVHGFGAGWYLVSPEGEKIEKEPPEKAR